MALSLHGGNMRGPWMTCIFVKWESENGKCGLWKVETSIFLCFFAILLFAWKLISHGLAFEVFLSFIVFALSEVTGEVSSCGES